MSLMWSEPRVVSLGLHNEHFSICRLIGQGRPSPLRARFRSTLHFPPWIQMHPHQFSVTWGVPWDADLVILSIALVKTSLFTTLNYQFPFWETLSHDGVRRRLEASSTHSRSGIASASHNIALQGKASCAAAQRLSEEPRIMQ